MRWRPDRNRLAVAALLASMPTALAAASPEQTLVLEVVINGRSTGRVAEVIDRDGALFVTSSQLLELGLVVPADIAATEEPIALATIPNLRATYEAADQSLVIAATDAALRPTELTGESSVGAAPLSPSGYGALLNYDVAATHSGRSTTGGALFDMRAFSPHGLLHGSAVLNLNPSAGQKRFVRLDTNFTHTQVSKLRRWRVGDVVSGALPWSRAIRLGGIQVASDFGLRPDLITYPLPVISGSAALPSTVSVLVNGVEQLSQPVPPGPFTMRTLPVVTGSGDVAVAVLDALGRQTMITLPFYASTALLKPGLGSYSLEVGLVRQDYGQAGDRYSGWAASQSSRFGLTEWLTLESHAEATGRLGLLGVGATLRVGNFGILNAAAAGSIGRRSGSAHASGGLVSAGFQRISGRLNFAVSGTFVTPGYRDIASDRDAPLARWRLDAAGGYQLGKWGSLGLAYNRSIPMTRRRASPDRLSGMGAFTGRQVEMVTGSYSVSIAGRASFHASAFRDLRQGGAYGVSVGLRFALGGSTHASVESSNAGGRYAFSATIAKPAQEPDGFGYRVSATEGSERHRLAEVEYLSRWGRLSAGFDRSSGQSAGRAGIRGAVALVGGQLFASDRIDDSFAVVSTGDVAGVPVLYENRSVGRTNGRGKLLIPSLLSYRDNRLAVDATQLPPDVEVGDTARIVQPADRSGILVDFQIRRVAAALLTLRDDGGRPIPLGSIAKVYREAAKPVGHDGEVYVTGLKPTNLMEVVKPDGTSCHVTFDYRPVKGEVPLIGPLSCR